MHLWVVLVVGGVLTISFTYLFGMDSVRLHAVAVAGLSVLIALILYVIGTLDYPFNSGVRVNAEAFEQVLREVGATPIPDHMALRSTALSGRGYAGL